MPRKDAHNSLHAITLSGSKSSPRLPTPFPIPYSPFNPPSPHATASPTLRLVDDSLEEYDTHVSSPRFEDDRTAFSTSSSGGPEIPCRHL